MKLFTQCSFSCSVMCMHGCNEIYCYQATLVYPLIAIVYSLPTDDGVCRHGFPYKNLYGGLILCASLTPKYISWH